MKKLFALLLAMLMPLCAMADAYTFTLSTDTDDVLFPLSIHQTLLSFCKDLSAEQGYGYASLIQQLLDGLSLHVTTQDDALALSAEVAGRNLIDFAVYSDEDLLYATSSMLPGYALTKSAGLPDHDKQEIRSANHSSDWPRIFNKAKSAVSAWAASLESDVAYGEFTGDAYDGGTTCTTWSITDSDIAALVSSLMTAELQEALTNVLSPLGIDAGILYDQITVKSAQVADEDTYAYILRSVEDQNGELRGCSLTIFEAGEQVATISLGTINGEFTLVVGLGLDEQNYWWRFTASKTQRNNITFFDGTSQEWLADKQQAFSRVSEMYAPLTNLEWQCNVAKSGERYLWDASLFEDNDPTNSRLVYLSSKGTVIPNAKKLDGSITIGYKPDIPLEMHFAFAPAEPIPAFDAALKLCSVSDPSDVDLYTSLTEKVMAGIIARLLKILPLDMMKQINQFLIPN